MITSVERKMSNRSTTSSYNTQSDHCEKSPRYSTLSVAGLAAVSYNSLNSSMQPISAETASIDRAIPIPSDPEQMRTIIEDLTRRLYNAQHTITAHKEIAKNALLEADQSKKELVKVSRQLQLEIARNTNTTRKHKREVEVRKYEEGLKVIEALNHELKLLIIDQQMSKSKLMLSKIPILKDKISKLQHTSKSQATLIQSYKDMDELAESLCKACQLGELEECRTLIDVRGVNPNDVDTADYLPIHYACAYGSYEIVKLLLDAGSDAGTYITGTNPIEMACRHGHYSLISLLCEYGGDVNDVGVNKCPPIISAVKGGHIGCIDELFRLGADVIQAKDSSNNTVLHVAATVPDSENIIYRILNHGAIELLSYRNLEGFTPLQVAQSKANASAIEALTIKKCGI